MCARLCVLLAMQYIAAGRGWACQACLCPPACLPHRPSLPPHATRHTPPSSTTLGTTDDNSLMSLPSGTYLDGLHVLGIDWRVLFK